MSVGQKKGFLWQLRMCKTLLYSLGYAKYTEEI